MARRAVDKSRMASRSGDLIHGHLMHIDDFGLQILQIRVVEIKLDA
jgi:hypothetical protein